MRVDTGRNVDATPGLGLAKEDKWHSMMADKCLLLDNVVKVWRTLGDNTPGMEDQSCISVSSDMLAISKARTTTNTLQHGLCMYIRQPLLRSWASTRAIPWPSCGTKMMVGGKLRFMRVAVWAEAVWYLVITYSLFR
jgi:hypothetical protein